MPNRRHFNKAFANKVTKGKHDGVVSNGNIHTIPERTGMPNSPFFWTEKLYWMGN